MLRNPEIPTRRKIVFFVVGPPLAFAGTLAFAVRHYALVALRLVRHRGRS
jgi:hypothetical protein